MPPPLITNLLRPRTSNSLSQANATGISQANVNQPNANPQQVASQDASVLQEFQPSALTPPRLPASMVAQEEPSSSESQAASDVDDTFSAFEQKIKDSNNAQPQDPASKLNFFERRGATKKIDELDKKINEVDVKELDGAAIKESKKTRNQSKTDRAVFRRADNRKGIDLNQLVDRHELANKAGVNNAKRTFAQKLGGAIVVGLVGIALTAAAIITGGAGFAIAAGMTGAVALRLAADARYAKMAVKNAEAQAAGLPPPHDLPMGTDSVANLFFKACPSSWSEKTRRQVARVASFGADAVLQAASGLLGSGAIVLPMVSIGLVLLGINHAVRAFRSNIPDLEKTIRDGAQKASEAASDSIESAFKEKPKDTLEGLMQDAANQLEIYKEEISKLAPSVEKDALKQALEAKEKQLDRQIGQLARLIETLPFEASTPSSQLKETAKTVGLGAAMVGLDFGVKTGVSVFTGVQGLDFASSAIDLGMTLAALHNNNNQLQTSRDFLIKTNPDFAGLHQRQLNEKFIQQVNLDDFEIEMTIEESMTQMHNFIRA